MEEDIMVPPGDGPETLNLPLVRTAILKPVLLALQNEGHEISDFLDGHRINEAQLYDAVYAIFQEAAARKQPDFCARVGQSLDWEQFFPLYDQLAGAAVTLSDFITRFVTAGSKEANSVTQSLLVEGQHAYFSAKRKFKPKISQAPADCIPTNGTAPQVGPLQAAASATVR